MDARQSVQIAVADLATKILSDEKAFDSSQITSKCSQLIDELKIEEQNQVAFNKLFNEEFIKAVADQIKNEIIAKSKILSEEDIKSLTEKLKGLGIEGLNYDEFPVQLRKMLKDVLSKQQELKLTEQTCNAIGGTVASIAWIKSCSTDDAGMPLCPILNETLNINEKSKIVTLSDGCLYDAVAIAKWAIGKDTSPWDRSKLTSDDHQRIKAKVPGYKLPEERQNVIPNQQQPNQSSSARASLGLLAFGFILGAAVFLAGGSVLATLLTGFLSPVGVLAGVALIEGCKYLVERWNAARQLPQQGEGIPERKEGGEAPRVEHRNSFRDFQARVNNPQPARAQEIELAEIKEQKVQQKRRDSSPSLFFSHHESKEGQPADEKKVEIKRRFSQ